jgi:cellulose synthase/poly-beta-1,6-N-acetylglucosamine synthase-like glycosyltransferase
LKTERRWIFLVFAFIGLWLLVLGSTLFSTITKSGLLIDKEVDLSYVTMPLLGIILVYTLITIFIFVVYLVTFDRVKRYQISIKSSPRRDGNDITQSASKIYSSRAGEKSQERLAINNLSMTARSLSQSNKICSIITPFVFRAVSFLLFIGYFIKFNITNRHHFQLQLTKESGTGQKSEVSSSVKELSMTARSLSQSNKICSIIIPSKNEESVIKRTISKCLNQTHKDIEVVVVCHNCTDFTFEEAKQVADPRVKVFDFKTKESGKGIALNFGLKQAAGEFILILDGDGILSHDFIEQALPLFGDGYAAVQGRYMPSNRDYSILTKLLSIEGDLWSTPYMTMRSFLDKRCGLGGTGYIVRKSILMEEGMFANHLVDDYELTFRLLRKKHRIAFAPLCIDYDEKPPTLEIMLRQRARWARGFISLLSKRVAEPSDLIGNIHWLSPIAAISGLIMLLIPAYASIHYFMYEYYPYTYSYMPLNVWYALTGMIYGLQCMVLYKQYGIKGLKYALYLPLYNAFSHYWFVSFSKAFFVKSWANTKTTHGFSKIEKKEFQRKRPKKSSNMTSQEIQQFHTLNNDVMRPARRYE